MRIRAIIALAACLCASAPAAGAQAPGDASPGAVLPFAPVGGPDRPPLPAGVPIPPLGSPPDPAPVPSLARLFADRPAPRAALRRGLSDGSALVLLGQPALAAATIARARPAGASVVRVPLSWRTVERRSPDDPANPDDSAYNFSSFDDLLRQLAFAGIEPLVTVYEAPASHEAPGRWPFARPGTWAPDPAAYGRFATAVARRYTGAHPDPRVPGQTLPRVRLWQAWNEPNLAHFLQPQWIVRGGRWRPYSPLRYRAMLNAFTLAVKSVDPTARVMTAGTAPVGEARDGEGRMTPVRFWQALLCLGTAPHIRLVRCPDPARFDLLAHHPLSVGAPSRPSPGPLDVAIADLDRIGSLLRVAQRHGRVLPAGGQEIAVTELNWDSNPPSSRGVPAALLPRYVAAGLYLLWRQGVALVFWEIARDPVPAPGSRLHPAGLYRFDPSRPLDPSGDRPKPALRAFRMPFVALRRAADVVHVWGLVAAPGARRAVIQARRNGRWRALAEVPVTLGGLVDGSVSVAGRARLRLVEPASGAWSVAWAVGARRSLVPRP